MTWADAQKALDEGMRLYRTVWPAHYVYIVQHVNTYRVDGVEVKKPTIKVLENGNALKPYIVTDADRAALDWNRFEFLGVVPFPQRQSKHERGYKGKHDKG